MNEAHFHLVVNHLPVIFPIAAIIVMITGFISKSEPIKRTALMLFMIGAITTLIAMRSGEEAEHFVENMSDISEHYVEEHEEAAELFSILSYLLGGIAAIGLWASVKQKSFAGIAQIVVLVFACVAIYFGKEAATTGGEIRHPEIRADYTATTDAQKHTGDDD